MSWISNCSSSPGSNLHQIPTATLQIDSTEVDLFSRAASLQKSYYFSPSMFLIPYILIIASTMLSLNVSTLWEYTLRLTKNRITIPINYRVMLSNPSRHRHLWRGKYVFIVTRKCHQQWYSTSHSRILGYGRNTVYMVMHTEASLYSWLTSIWLIQSFAQFSRLCWFILKWDHHSIFHKCMSKNFTILKAWFFHNSTYEKVVLDTIITNLKSIGSKMRGAWFKVYNSVFFLCVCVYICACVLLIRQANNCVTADFGMTK